MSGASSYRCIRAVGTVISGPPNRLILPALWRTHPGLLDANEFEPGILALLQCSALRRPALPGLQSHEHDPERLQGPRCEMQHKRQRHFAFVLRRRLRRIPSIAAFRENTEAGVLISY